MHTYHQPQIETMPPEELRKLQDERLKAQVKHVYESVPHYRQLMDEKGVKPEDIRGVDDLWKLPFTSKADLRECYPDGMLAIPKSECVRIHSTSGTTGKRVIAYYNQHDIDLWEDCCARAIVAAGGSAEDVCQFMQDLGATILCCTPSYAAYIGETVKEMGIKPEDLKLKAGIFGAEAWSDEMRADIEKSLGLKAYNIYGLTELSGPGVSFECEQQDGMHINEDHFIAEIIDPETGAVLPDGPQGELVFTAITKQAFPVIRYRTRDICVLHRGTCSCGRTFVKMGRPMGRTDDMLIIRGVNVFPSQIEAVLIQQGYSSNYQIVVDRVRNTDTFDVYVEMNPEQFSDAVRKITLHERALVEAMRSMLGISPSVHLVAPKSIARSEGKAVRVVDKRKI